MSRTSRTHNRHHLWYPRRDYTSSIEREFRNLSCHVVMMEIEAHAQLHATQKPPRKPKLDYMLRVVHEHRKGQCEACHARD